MGDGVPIEEWANEFMYVACLIPISGGGIVKARINSPFVACIRPEAGWSSHDQVELRRKT